MLQKIVSASIGFITVVYAVVCGERREIRIGTVIVLVSPSEDNSPTKPSTQDHKGKVTRHQSKKSTRRLTS